MRRRRGDRSRGLRSCRSPAPPAPRGYRVDRAAGLPRGSSGVSVAATSMLVAQSSSAVMASSMSPRSTDSETRSFGGPRSGLLTRPRSAETASTLWRGYTVPKRSWTAFPTCMRSAVMPGLQLEAWTPASEGTNRLPYVWRNRWPATDVTALSLISPSMPEDGCRTACPAAAKSRLIGR